MKLDKSQLAAIEYATDGGKLRIITGGAGTGKTTIIKAIMQRIKGQGDLLAPTGKAAQRLREATGLDAQTIHRWLKWTGDTIERAEPTAAPVIIDEASMVDAWLLARVLQFAIGPVILVGDAAQLAPVGAGQPFRDILAAYPGNVARLTTCHRATAAINVAAISIRGGKLPAIRDLKSGGERFAVLETGDLEETAAWLVEMVKATDYDPDVDMVICAKNETRRRLNAELAAVINPRTGTEPFRAGDRVMNLKNNAALDWYNGDAGWIHDIDTAGRPWVIIDRGPNTDRSGADAVKLERDAARDITLAYAITVHKSQGSQARRVYFAATAADSFLLDRSLVYTAVTRGRESVFVVGHPAAIAGAINRTAGKRTALQYQIAKKTAEHVPL